MVRGNAWAWFPSVEAGHCHCPCLRDVPVTQQQVNDKGLSGLLSVTRDLRAVQRILGFSRVAGNHSPPAFGRVRTSEYVSE